MQNILLIEDEENLNRGISLKLKKRRLYGFLCLHCNRRFIYISQ